MRRRRFPAQIRSHARRPGSAVGRQRATRRRKRARCRRPARIRIHALAYADNKERARLPRWKGTQDCLTSSGSAVG